MKPRTVTESKLTRCPGCATVFRITPEQLALREGQVRCGHCRAVFDANDHFVSLDTAPPPDVFEPPEATRVEERIFADDAENARGVAFAEAPGAGPPGEGAGGERATGERPAVADPTGERPTDEGPSGPDATHEGAAEEGPAAAHPARAGAAEAGSATVEPEPGPHDRVTGEEALTAPAADTAVAGVGTDELYASQTIVDTPAADPTEADIAEADTAEADTAEAHTTEADTTEADTTEADTTEADARAAPIGAALGGPAERFQWKKRRLHTVPPRAYAVVAAVLVAGLLLQLVLEYRDTLAAYVPATRPLLAAACKPLGCAIGPLRDGAALSIDASDLQADPAHRGLLLLSATIRNRAGHAIAFPYLELMLTDSSDRIVVRRAFPPVEYASGSADIAAGIPPNGEHVVRMFLDASATQQAGYRVYLFYP